MIPILFEPKTKNFNSNGLGRLMDATSCLVTEERNGEYELELKYPIDGILSQDIKMASIIWAEPGEGKEPQPFSVYKVSKPLNGIVTINAEHMSYQLSYIPCAPFTARTAAGALSGFEQHAAEDCPYTFWTDKTNSGSFAVSVPASIRSRLGGVEGSILDVFGGEFEFDRYTVKLWENRGADNGVVLRYGKNITDLTQEENISNTITGIYPYWADSDGNLVELPEKVISSEKASNFPYPRTISVDFSSKFQGQPTTDELRAAAEAYIKSNNVGIPSVSISVSFVPLWQTEEYKDLALLESVKLCDVITVDYEKLGVKAKAKIVRTVYDVLKGRYQSLEVGDVRATLASTIAEQNQQIADKPSKGFLDDAVRNATNWLTGVNGGYVVFHKNANGQPYEILIMDTDDIDTAKNVWRWNQNGWGHSKNGYNGPYTMAATIDGGILADFITAGTMLADRIKGGTLTLGGKNNGDGTFSLKNVSGSEIVGMDSSGIRILAGLLQIGKLFSVDTQGNVVANSLKSTNAEITGGRVAINATQDNTVVIRIAYGNTEIAISPGRIDCIDHAQNRYAQISPGMVDVGEYYGNSYTQRASMLYSGMITSQYAYSHTDSGAPNVVIWSNGLFLRSASSSMRYKEDITEEISDELDPKHLYDVPVKMFKYKPGYLRAGDPKAGKDVIGLIVEDLEQLYPDAVQYNAEGEPEMWNSHVMIPAMLKLLQEQNKRITELEKKNEVI